MPMPMPMPLLRTLFVTVVALASFSVLADDLKVLTAGAFKPVLLAVQPEFEKATGHRLLLDNDTAGALQKRVAAGETFDVVFSSASSLQAMQAAGKVRAGSIVPLVRGGIGVAVARGMPVPDLSEEDEFRSLLLGVRRVALIDPASGGSSGIYMARLFERLGIANAVAAKSLL